ncbi:hypothetical protein FQN50_003395 [Emmonsiellopsis sp. PD_5]|nr:hypothetical protein FQN50_003395 [Emmonsiellopsis sp. PD_5]
MASPTISGVEAGQFGFDIIVVFFDGTHNSRCSAGNLSLKTFTDAPSPTLVRTSYLQPRPSTSKVQGLSQPRIRAGGSGFSKPQKLAELALSSRRTDDRALLVKDIAHQAVE